MDFWSPHEDEPSQRLQELACHVLEQARDDLRWLAKRRHQTVLQRARDDGMQTHYRLDAVMFLTGATPEWRESLATWCGLAQIPVKAIQADARQGCPRKMMTTVRNKQKPRDLDDAV